ncbi:hypothetical protein J6590_052438 [Homalodisca vitripennis]|nr:hypothetical protein J6590_052438 [Homalodisca vitripennis]
MKRVEIFVEITRFFLSDETNRSQARRNKQVTFNKSQDHVGGEASPSGIKEKLYTGKPFKGGEKATERHLYDYTDRHNVRSMAAQRQRWGSRWRGMGRSEAGNLIVACLGNVLWMLYRPNISRVGIALEQEVLVIGRMAWRSKSGGGAEACPIGSVTASEISSCGVRSGINSSIFGTFHMDEVILSGTLY